jgi:hypothetical protein
VHIQIGQVMLNTPNSWYKMGLIPGTLMIIWGTLLGICECVLVSVLLLAV